MDNKIINIEQPDILTTNTDNLQELTTEQTVEIDELSQYKTRVEQYITFISSIDNGLIDYEYIYNRGHHYIKLYKEEYLPYLNKLEQVTKKYYNSKKYGFNNTNKNFEVISLKDNSSVIKVDKPAIRNVIDYLKKAKIQIQRDRFKLSEKYNSYLTDKNLTSGMITGFNKKRSYLINKLNEYYAIQYYYNRINLINNNFIISSSSELGINKMQYSLKYLPNEKYKANIEKITNLRNQFITANLSEDKEGKNLIKEYIKEKIKFDKKESKPKEIIDTIIINKDIILHKFIFNNNTINNN
jgi:hypothetical protein